LEEGQVQADSTGLPVKALREAVVNALMHRSYRVHSPIQVIRYDNRIVIRNPGYSLKSEDLLGCPGSEQRNPGIAAVFHETNLAETKGTGIRAMRGLLEKAHLAPPTFESDRGQNMFITHLLLHHFLSEEDINWLMAFDPFQLNDNQKRGLIMLRELGAMNNLSYRQQSGLDTLAASQELRAMRDIGLLEMKGKGSQTYYVAGRVLLAVGGATSEYGSVGQPSATMVQIPQLRIVKAPAGGTNAPVAPANTPATLANAPDITDPPSARDTLLQELSEEEHREVQALKRRLPDPAPLTELILKLCKRRAYTNQELAILLDREEKGLRRNFLQPLVTQGKLQYKYPGAVSHPDQAYILA